MTKADEVAWIEAMKEKGEVVNADEWGIQSVKEVTDPEAEKGIHALMFNASPKDGAPQDESSDGDTGLFKIRYRYGPSELKGNSREFCVFMVGRARENVVYRKEEIEQMEADAINGSFAPRGESKYSIWLWKGGVYCHHRWYRVIYFRKRGPGGAFLPRSTGADLENDKKVSLPAARTAGIPESKINTSGWPDAATRPIDTPNKGKLN